MEFKKIYFYPMDYDDYFEQREKLLLNLYNENLVLAICNYARSDYDIEDLEKRCFESSLNDIIGSLELQTNNTTVEEVKRLDIKNENIIYYEECQYGYDDWTVNIIAKKNGEYYVIHGSAGMGYANGVKLYNNLEEIIEKLLV